jgi:lipoprotein-anchoring transpeptidase ErfK/SrfK
MEGHPPGPPPLQFVPLEFVPYQANGHRRRGVLAALAALVPIVPIVIAIVISSGGTPAKASGAAYTPAAALPATPPSTTTQASSNPTALPPGNGALVALIRRPTTMRVSPGGRKLAAVALKTVFGTPQELLVVKRTDTWLGVVSPQAGNGQIGWIPRSVVRLDRVSWVLRVSLSARKLTVLDNNQVMERYTIAVGAPYAPTPTGRFAVTDRLNTGDPSGPYGCCILALSAQAPHAIQGWSGGNRIAIHSTPETSSIGQAVSHGCMRLTLPEGRWLLAHIPLGTPTLISS